MSTATTDVTFRATPEEKNLIKLAAEVSQSTVSDFVRSLAVQRAMDLVSHLRLRETTFMPNDEFEALMATIDVPDEVPPPLRRAFQNLWKLELD